MKNFLNIRKVPKKFIVWSNSFRQIRPIRFRHSIQDESAKQSSFRTHWLAIHWPATYYHMKAAISASNNLRYYLQTIRNSVNAIYLLNIFTILCPMYFKWLFNCMCVSLAAFSFIGASHRTISWHGSRNEFGGAY